MARTFADPAGVFVLDDTTFPKAGTPSVGVQCQYCGAPGKKANCQAAVSLHYVDAKGHVPLGLRLFLPASWSKAPARLDEAGGPESQYRKKPATPPGVITLPSIRRALQNLLAPIAKRDCPYGRPFILSNQLTE